jgi:glycosyltransferase involved in cell wall biosynthesis
MKPISISAVIPAYNEEARIFDTVKSVFNYVDEVIVIDDGSQDQTFEKAQEAGAKVISQSIRSGYINAIKKGFKEAQGSIVVTIDADGEFPSEKIPELVKPILQDKADMVQGHRNSIHRISERFISWIANQKAPVGDCGTGFRAIKKPLACELELKGACICGIFSLEVHTKGGRIAEIQIQLRSVGKSRNIAWYHINQFFYLIPWLFRGNSN